MQNDVALPKKWKELTTEEQREWINTYYMPKTRIPEPIFTKTDKIEKATLKLKSGAELEFPETKITMTRNNPNIVREYEFWLGNWLITVFHDKQTPATKFLTVSNPHSGKWIAQELNIEIWRRLSTLIFQLGHKYRLFSYYKPKSWRKKHVFTLRHKNYTREGSTDA